MIMKLSKTLKARLFDINQGANWHMGIAARIANKDSSLPSHFVDKGAEFYRGLAQGQYAAISSILNAHKCYNGFNTRIAIDNPEFEYEDYMF
jgi:hypothetical protein